MRCGGVLEVGEGFDVKDLAAEMASGVNLALWTAKKRVAVAREVVHGVQTIVGVENRKNYQFLMEKKAVLERGDAEAVIKELALMSYVRLTSRMETLWERATKAGVWETEEAHEKGLRTLLYGLTKTNVIHIPKLEDKFKLYRDRHGLKGDAVGMMLSAYVRIQADSSYENRYLRIAEELPPDELRVALERYIHRCALLKLWDRAVANTSRCQGWSLMFTNLILGAGIKHREPNQALQCYDNLRECGAEGDAETLNMLIILHSLRGDHAVVTAIFNMCRQQNIKMGVKALGEASISLRAVGRLDWAQWALIELKNYVFDSKNTNYWQHALESLESFGLHDETFQIFTAQRERQIPTAPRHFTKAAHALYAMGRHEKALAMLTIMKDNKKQPDRNMLRILERCDKFVDDPDILDA